MEQKKYASIDILKFISAMLVIAIHCAPFIEVSEPFNFFFVQIIGRLAVPFFFITSGFLFFRKIDLKKGWKDKGNLAHLKHYWLRILKIYLVWSVLYLPLVFLSWFQGGFDGTTLIRFFRDILCNGTYYHLWFLPALLLAIPLVYLLATTLKKRIVLGISVLLYVIGMLDNVYGGVLREVAGIGSILQALHVLFGTTRNGLFFGPVFITLGIYAQDFLDTDYRRPAGIAFLISFAFFCGEAYLLRSLEIMHDLTSMYLMIVPCVFFLLIFLLQLHLKDQPVYATLRNMSLLIYVSHIYIIFIFLQVLHLPNLLVYGIACAGSALFAYMVLRVQKKFPVLKCLY